MLRTSSPRSSAQNERDLKKLCPIVAQVNALESSILSVGRTARFAARPRNSGARRCWGNTRTLDLPEAFAVVREAGRRVLNMRHFDAVLIAAPHHQGRIAEMKTGEGKTLVATPACLSERTRRQGRPRCHGERSPHAAATRRTGKIHRFLGMTAGVIQHELTGRRAAGAYGADITLRHQQ